MPLVYNNNKPIPKKPSALFTDWMKAIKTPASYRVNRSFSFNFHRSSQCLVIMLLFLTGVLLFLLAIKTPDIPQIQYYKRYQNNRQRPYNYTYPLSKPTLSVNGDTIYKFAIISDLDTLSQTKEGVWVSHLRKGKLIISPDKKKVKVTLEEKETLLSSEMSMKGRAMELSDLIVFDGKLLSCDDRTGIVFEITEDNKVIPFVLLSDGDGRQAKSFKCEWMTVKDQELWIGGLGKEWTSSKGIIENLYPQWVKSVGYLGDVQHHYWVNRYNKLRKLAGCQAPGYIIHEAVTWSNFHKKWFFLPRRASNLTYDDIEDEKRATNLLFTANDEFEDVTLTTLGPKHPTKGFSSFKFIPNTFDSMIVALKSMEDSGKISSYLMVFDLQGNQLIPEIEIGKFKYEGIEFV